MIVSSDMDWLVQSHLRILPTLANIYTGRRGVWHGLGHGLWHSLKSFQVVLSD